MAAFAAMTDDEWSLVKTVRLIHHSMAALRGGHPGQHAKIFERVTLDGRVKPGHGVWGGLRKPASTVHTEVVALLVDGRLRGHDVE